MKKYTTHSVKMGSVAYCLFYQQERNVFWEKMLHQNVLGVLALGKDSSGNRKRLFSVARQNQWITFSLLGKACCWDSADWHGCPCEPDIGNCSGSSDSHGGSDQPWIDSISYIILLVIYFNIEVLRNQIFPFLNSIW